MWWFKRLAVQEQRMTAILEAQHQTIELLLLMAGAVLTQEAQMSDGVQAVQQKLDAALAALQTAEANMEQRLGQMLDTQNAAIQSLQTRLAAQAPHINIDAEVQGLNTVAQRLQEFHAIVADPTSAPPSDSGSGGAASSPASGGSSSPPVGGTDGTTPLPAAPSSSTSTTPSSTTGSSAPSSGSGTPGPDSSSPANSEPTTPPAAPTPHGVG